jgi:hypothetical protein
VSPSSSKSLVRRMDELEVLPDSLGFYRLGQVGVAVKGPDGVIYVNLYLTDHGVNAILISPHSSRISPIALGRYRKKSGRGRHARRVLTSTNKPSIASVRCPTSWHEGAAPTNDGRAASGNGRPAKDLAHG